MVDIATGALVDHVRAFVGGTLITAAHCNGAVPDCAAMDRGGAVWEQCEANCMHLSSLPYHRWYQGVPECAVCAPYFECDSSGTNAMNTMTVHADEVAINGITVDATPYHAGNAAGGTGVAIYGNGFSANGLHVAGACSTGVEVNTGGNGASTVVFENVQVNFRTSHGKKRLLLNKQGPTQIQGRAKGPG